MDTRNRSSVLVLIAATLAAALIGLIPLAASSAMASSCESTTWQGTADDEWTNSANWDNGVPQTCWSVTLDGTNSTHPHIIDAPTIVLTSLSITGGVSVAGGTDTVITAATVDWSGGTSFLGLVAQGGLTITGTGNVLHNGTDANIETVENDGVAVMIAGSSLSLESGAKVLNEGQWTTQAGTANITGDICCQTLNTFENHGTVDASGGELTMSNMGYVGSSTGVVKGDLNLSGGSHTLPDGTTVKGSGSVLQLTNSADVAVSGTIHLDNQGHIAQESGATVTGTAVTFKGNGIGGNGVYDWSSGTISASPTFLQGADLLVEGGGAKTLEGSSGSKHGVMTIDLGVTATEEGTGTLTLSKAAIQNNGIWKVPSGQVVHMAGNACCAKARRSSATSTRSRSRRRPGWTSRTPTSWRGRAAP